MEKFTPIGVLGGTFDPIHYGHLRLAEEIGQSLGLQQILFIPSGYPPHRNKPVASSKNRSQMVQLAIDGQPLFTLDSRELALSGSCYTVDTLQSLTKELGSGHSLCLLLGADAFLGLTTWHQWEKLFELAHIVVACRPGYDIETQLPEVLRAHWLTRFQDSPKSLESKKAGIIMLQKITPLAISASKIRELINMGKSPRYLLPDIVLDYIYHHKLYNLEEHGS